MTELFVADVTLRHHPINCMRRYNLCFGYHGKPHLFLCFSVISQVKIVMAIFCTKNIYSGSFVEVIFERK